VIFCLCKHIDDLSVFALFAHDQHSFPSGVAKATLVNIRFRAFTLTEFGFTKETHEPLHSSDVLITYRLRCNSALA